MDPGYLDQLVQRGVISDDVASRLTSGEPQRQSRFDILRQGLDAAKDYLTPGYFRDTPSSPQADRALADPNARPGKIGPPSGPPTGMQIAGGLAGDVGLNALPAGKLSGAALAKWLAANGVPWKPAEIEALRKMANAGSLDMEQLPGRTKAAANNVMSKLGLSLTESPNYVPPGAIAGDPEKQARIMELLAKKKSLTEIASHPDVDLGYDAVRKYVNNRMGVRVARGTDWDDPDRIQAYKTMTAQNLSVRQMANSLSVNDGLVSKQLAKMRGAGHLPGYAPMGGTRTPSTPQTKSQARPITPQDVEIGQDFSKALAAFMPQYK